MTCFLDSKGHGCHNSDLDNLANSTNSLVQNQRLIQDFAIGLRFVSKKLESVSPAKFQGQG